VKPIFKKKGSNRMPHQPSPINGVCVSWSLSISEASVRDARKIFVKILELIRLAFWIGPTYHLAEGP